MPGLPAPCSGTVFADTVFADTVFADTAPPVAEGDVLDQLAALAEASHC